MRALLLTISVFGLFAVAGCGGSDSSGSSEPSEPSAQGGEAIPVASDAEAAKRTKPQASKSKGAAPEDLVEKDLIEGSGPTAEKGKEVTIQYLGFDYATGKVFASSWEAQPYSFKAGSGAVVPGLEQGIEGMKSGGRRELIIPPRLGVAPGGEPPTITAVFVIDLLKVS